MPGNMLSPLLQLSLQPPDHIPSCCLPFPLGSWTGSGAWELIRIAPRWRVQREESSLAFFLGPDHRDPFPISYLRYAEQLSFPPWWGRWTLANSPQEVESLSVFPSSALQPAGPSRIVPLWLCHLKAAG